MKQHKHITIQIQRTYLPDSFPLPLKLECVRTTNKNCLRPPLQPAIVQVPLYAAPNPIIVSKSKSIHKILCMKSTCIQSKERTKGLTSCQSTCIQLDNQLPPTPHSGKVISFEVVNLYACFTSQQGLQRNPDIIAEDMKS